MKSRMPSIATRFFMALAAALCVGGATGASAAIEPAAGAAAQVPIEELEVLAEIRVRGKRLARSIEDAEDDFFKLYNQLNRDEQYDVVCGHMRLDGSLIIQRACVPGFIADRLPPRPVGLYSNGAACGWSTSFSRFRTGAPYDTSSSYHCSQAPVAAEPPLIAVALHKREAYLDNVLKVINSDQRLVAKVRHLDSLYAEMLAAQSRYTRVRATHPVKFDPRLRPR